MAVNSNVSLRKINCYENYADLNIVADVTLTDIPTHPHTHPHTHTHIHRPINILTNVKEV
jgi:hypothetical protein